MIIYTTDGAVIIDAPITKSAKVKNVLMGDHYIDLPFNLREQVAFPRGSYIFYKSYKFKIKDVVNPEFDSKTGGYKYNLRFWARQNDMKDVALKWLKSPNAETSFHDTTDLASFANLIADNMNAFEGTTNWKVASIPDNLAETTKLVSFNGDSCWNALSLIAETFETEWWTVENGVEIWIYFGKLEVGTPEIFRRGEIISSIPARNGDNSEYGTRFYAFGSTRNIPEDYYPVENGGITNHVSEKRLHLPGNQQYVDAWSPLAKEDIIEQVVYFDDVYPKNTETITRIETIPRKVENSEDDEQQSFDAYVMYCEDTPFIPSDVMTGETLRCRFTSGSLNGREFDLALIRDNSSHTVIDPAGWKPEDGYNKKFEIIADQEDMGEGLPLIIPNASLHPKAGDTFILTGVTLPRQRIEEAEEELLEVAKAWAIKNSSDTNVYDCPTNPVYCTLNDKNYDLGQRVVLEDERFGPEGRSSRIQSYEKDLYNEYVATYTVGDNTAYSRIGQIEKDIAEAAYAERIGIVSGIGVYIIRSQYDATTPSDYNVYSARATDRFFLDKRSGGIVHSRTTFARGVQLGSDFISGLAGIGGMIDGSGNAELDSLSLRRFLEVPELRYNRTEVLIGNTWNAAGGGIIESVQPDTDAEGNMLMSGVVTLHLEQGEIGAVAVDDICMGIFHDGENLSNNATEDSDDSKGNFSFAGFSTVYFRITEILDKDDNSRFRYALRTVDSAWKYTNHPCAAMHFVGYGNFTDVERQTSRYSTRTYERYLKDVDNWTFSAENIAAQFGDLSNLNVFGLNMQGYSAYLNNIYMTGRIQQFTPEGQEIPTINDRGHWDPDQTYNKNDDVYHNNAKWRCLVDGTTSEPSTASAEWQLLEEALKGDAGPVGPQGPVGPAGPDGENGCIYRVTEWAYNFEYHNDTEGDHVKNTIRYLDIVTVSNGTSQQRYRCRECNVSSASNKPGTPGGADFWEELNDMAPIYTPLLLADNAVINFMTGMQLLIHDKGGNVVGGFVGDETPLWIGSNIEDKDKANFRVGIKGDVHAKQIFIYAGTDSRIGCDDNKQGGLILNAARIVNSGDYCIQFNRDDSTYAAIGTNTMPPSAGYKRLLDIIDNEPVFYDKVASVFSAQGAFERNVAISLSGGCISGAAFYNQYISDKTYATIESAANIVTLNNNQACTIVLPDVHDYDNGKTILIRNFGSGTAKLRVGKSYSYTTLGSNAERTDDPFMFSGTQTYTYGNDTWDEMSTGRAIIAIYNSLITRTYNGKTYRGFWHLLKLPTSW